MWIFWWLPSLTMIYFYLLNNKRSATWGFYYEGRHPE
jgi:hypothetical protein